MQLPGRYRSTSLGDLLGRLHRAGATGTLELAEDNGWEHRIHLVRGLVVGVELDGASPCLTELLRRAGMTDEEILRRSLLRAMASSRLHGEVLVDDFCVSPEIVGRALRLQLLSKLAVLERRPDARVAFRVAVRVPRGALLGRRGDARGAPPWDAPLGPQEFLRGRRRARDGALPPHDRGASACARVESPAPGSAWEALGVPPGVGREEIKRAYRRLAKSVHPDLHPMATHSERAAYEARFIAITDAYRSLVGAD